MGIPDNGSYSHTPLGEVEVLAGSQQYPRTTIVHELTQVHANVFQIESKSEFDF
jgi:hypothetical protein